MPGIQALRQCADTGVGQVQTLQLGQVFSISRPLRERVRRIELQLFQLHKRGQIQVVECRWRKPAALDMQRLQRSERIEFRGEIRRQRRRICLERQVLELSHLAHRLGHGRQRRYAEGSRVPHATALANRQTAHIGKSRQKGIRVGVAQTAPAHRQLADMRKVSRQRRQRLIDHNRQSFGTRYFLRQRCAPPLCLEQLGDLGSMQVRRIVRRGAERVQRHRRPAHPLVKG